MTPKTASWILAPMHGGAWPRQPKILSQTAGNGATDDVTDAVLPVTHMATILNHTAVPIRYTLAASATALAVGASYTVLGPYAAHHWTVESETKWVAVDAQDQSSAYEASVWVSSPRGS